MDGIHTLSPVVFIHESHSMRIFELVLYDFCLLSNALVPIWHGIKTTDYPTESPFYEAIF